MTRRKRHQITTARLKRAIADDEGYCLVCKEFTTDGVEPDAESYECPDCGRATVSGAEELLFTDSVEIVD